MPEQLPNCEKARIADAKLYNYLLNPMHPHGRSKARFYELIGYTTTNGERLRADLLTLACSGSVVTQEPNSEGVKYTIIGQVDAPNGKTYDLKTVWAVEPPDNEPRLITAFPNH